MIGVAQRHDFRVAGVAARRQDGGLVGLRAAVGEERFGELAAGRDRGDLLRQRRLRLVGEHRGDVLQRVELAVHLGVHLVVAVPHAHRDDAAEEIQVLVAVGVPHVLVLGARHHQRLLVVMEDRGEQEFLVGENDFVFGHRT